MTEVAPGAKTVDWQQVKPLPRIVTAAFRDAIGDRPDQLHPDDFITDFQAVFPDYEGELLRLGSYGARNHIVRALEMVSKQRRGTMLHYLGRAAATSRQDVYPLGITRKLNGLLTEGVHTAEAVETTSKHLNFLGDQIFEKIS